MRHPDEGTIHGWLDGALTPAEAGALEAHVAECAECGAAVAEARGLRAAATRILGALDDVPAGVVPAPDSIADARAARAATGVGPRSGERIWSRPGLRAAAALVAVGGLSWAIARNVPAARQEAGVAVSVTDPAAAPTDAPARDAGQKPVPSEPAPVAEVQREERRRAAETATEVAAASVRRTPPPAPAPERTADAIPADRSAKAPTLGASVVAGPDRAAPEATQRIAQAQVSRVLVDRAYVDSVLAADSTAGAAEQETFGGVTASAERATLQRHERVPSAPPPDSPTAMRAQGCWLLDVAEWAPPHHPQDAMIPLPRRIELRLDRGSAAAEAGQRLLRPVPGEPPLPPGVAGYWRVIAADQMRLTLAGPGGWTAVTATVGADSLHGRARAYTESDGLMRRAAVTARRVVCRTEP